MALGLKRSLCGLFVFLGIGFTSLVRAFDYSCPVIQNNGGNGIGITPASQTIYPTFTTGGSANWGGVANGTRDFLHRSNLHRIRQSGAITKVKFYLRQKYPSLVGFYIHVRRKNNVGTYDMVGITQNLAGELTNQLTGKMYTIDLDNAISDVREGDYFGYRIVTSGASAYSLIAYPLSGGITTKYINNQVGNSNVNRDNNNTMLSSTFAPLIQLFMESPQVVFIGDSIVAGHPKNFSFIESTLRTGNTIGSIPYYFGLLTNATYQNMAIGGQTTTQIRNRFDRDVLQQNPSIVVLEGGVNDLYLGGTKTAYLDNMNYMFSGIQHTPSIQKGYVFAIMPRSNGTNAKMIARDEWNHDLKNLVQQYSKVEIVDVGESIGVARVNGTIGNLWNINPLYNADGVHFNSSGHAVMASHIVSKLCTLNTIAQKKFSVTISGTGNSGESIKLLSGGQVVQSQGITGAASRSFIVNNLDYGYHTYQYYFIDTNKYISPYGNVSFTIN